jgi:hypothetical protein
MVDFKHGLDDQTVALQRIVWMRSPLELYSVIVLLFSLAT